MLKTGVSILFLVCWNVCQAQSLPASDSSYFHYNLKLAYNSSVIYPGVSTGMEFPLQHFNKQVSKNKKHVRSFLRERLISGNLNWYHHQYFHDNLYLTAEWVMRRTKSTGFISEFSAGAGYSRTFLGGTTYKVDDKGNISIVRLAGYNYALITVGGGFGYDYSIKKHTPVSVFAKMNVISMFPYNSTLYFRPALELGFRYTPGRLKSKL
jgi:hypothetical protein